MALAGLFLFAVGEAMRMARPLVLPLALSFLLAVVFAPLVRRLRGLHLSYPLAAGIVVAAFTGATGYAVFALAEPATGWIERAPATLREVESRLREVKASMVEARQAADTVEKIASVYAGPPAPEVTVKEPSLAERVVTMTRAALVLAAEVVILLYFLLAFGDSFLRRLVGIPSRLRHKVHLLKIAFQIEREVSHYLLTVACINAGLGAATALAMYLLGMPNPVLWGVTAAVLNFVPYLGSTVTLIVLTIVAILTFDTLTRAMLPPAVFLLLATLEGQIINPLIVGKRMSLNPLVIAIALMAGLWIWGIAGLLIAVPVLAMVKICCSHNEDLAPIAEFLGRD
jgi:predicted PurR-regulated permease PerM